MRKILSLVGAVAFVASVAMPAFAADTVKGKLIDSVCFAKNGAKAAAAGHDACNMKCAKNGNTLAVFTADGTVYNITGDYAANKNEKLIEFVNKDVTVEGTVSEANGTKSIDATSITAAGTR
jgi:hypothetical protein